MWLKRGTEKDLNGVMERLTGVPATELTSPTLSSTGVGLNLYLMEAADLIRAHLDMNDPVFIVGDYDADGVTSSAILYKVLCRMGFQDVIVRLPRRESEGYGLKQVQLDEMKDGALLITVDNGIAAVEPIQKAVSGLHDVIVLDHHLPGDELPKPTVLADPWLFEDTNPFCGAGLAYTLATMLTDDENLLAECLSLAAIGTIADVVPLLNDNRYIVKNGLANINNGLAPAGLLAIIEEARLGKVDEGSVGYKIGPIINASGRMHDDGAMAVFNCLIETDRAVCAVEAQALAKVNEDRKQAVEKAMMQAESMITEEDLKWKALVLKLDVAEGILGVIAGRLAEKYQKAAICLAQSIATGVLKGSGRSHGTLNLKDALDECSGSLLGYGGHSGAAGLSLKEENLQTFIEAFRSCKAMCDAVMDADDNQYYDLEISENEVPAYVQAVEQFSPFGEGCPQPVFLVKDIQCVAKGSATYQFMAEKHIKMHTKEFDVVGFDLAQKFIDLDKPVRISAVGMLSSNSFMGRSGLVETIQMEAIDIEKGQTLAAKKQSPLAAALAAKLAQK